jgi:hypothetical protein
MLGFVPNGWWRDAWISRPMAGGAMLRYCYRWLAGQRFDFAPNSGMTLQFCTKWQRYALMLHPMLAAQCFNIAPDGGTMP